MSKAIILVTALLLCTSALFAQTGTLQIYCTPNVQIYLNDRYVGKTDADRSGILLENIMAGDVTVRAVQTGHETVTRNVLIIENTISEVSIAMVQAQLKHRTTVGIDLHFGTFGLFNVNDAFTKASYTFGATPFADYRIHQHFAIGGEIMSMWGKPETADHARWMLCPNLRISAKFNPFKRLGIHVLVAGGFSYWPESPDLPHLTPTLNTNRFGWDIRATAGVGYLIAARSSLNLSFGYWASSTTGDDIIWITHDTMLMGLGYGYSF
ncbi:MAG: hypothetical protein K9J06_05930 [Flavobacteriales bacterium]|nr:hypothetical protein [Flavobacteriales bacterium]